MRLCRQFAAAREQLRGVKTRRIADFLALVGVRAESPRQIIAEVLQGYGREQR